MRKTMGSGCWRRGRGRLMTPAAHAHELWFHPRPGSRRRRCGCHFGDTPDLDEAERVAEIAAHEGLGRWPATGSPAAAGRP